MMEDGKKCLGIVSQRTGRSQLLGKNTISGIKNASKVGTVNFANSLSSPSTVKKVCTKSCCFSNSQGT